MTTDVQPATWQDAFQKQSVSSIRAVEKQLRASVSRDREKLRALVGNNYRDLLATAEKIVTLAEETRVAESGISALSQACKPTTIEGKVTSPAANTVIRAQLKFLESTLRCASGSVQDGRLLLASKLLVISRLLVQQLENVKNATRIVQWLQGRLRIVRQHLVGTIDATLRKPNSLLESTAEAVAAYCLITSSPLPDALKHFQEIRAQRITQALPPKQCGKALRRLLQAKCHYLIATVTTLRALSGRIVNEVLNDLQKRPILESDVISSLETLQFDLYRPLLPTDIVTFIPYFKRTTLTSSEVRAGIQAWVHSTFDSIVGDLEILVADLKISSVIQLRQETLDILLPVCHSTFLDDSALGKARAVFTTRIVHLVETHARSVVGVVQQVSNDHSEALQNVFWRNEAIQPEKARSANEHIMQLRKNHLGVHVDLKASVRSLQKWARGCEKIKQQFQMMEKIRWQDKLEDIDDGDDEEEQQQAVITQLAENDPEIFKSKYSAALYDSCNAFLTSYTMLAHGVQADTTKGLDTNGVATLLRLGRETVIILNSLQDGRDSAELSQQIISLQNTLARRTSAELFGIIENMERADHDSFSTEELPSPTLINALRSLASVMLKNGGIDLWTASLTAETRRLIFERATSIEHKKYYISGDFDLYYLAAAMHQDLSTTSSNGIDALESQSSHKNATNARAIAYWKRTKVLFGIFAS